MSTLQKAVGVADQSSCQVSDAVTHSSTMPVSLLSHQDSAVCDSGSESMGFSDTDNEVGSSIKDTLLSIKVLNGEADRKVKSNGDDGTYGVNLIQNTKKVTESSTVVLLSEDEDHHNEEDKSKEEELLKNKLEEDRLLIDGKEELSSETPVNEDEEFRLLMEVDEEETQHKIVSRKNLKATTADPENEDKTLPDRVNSPVSDNGSSQSSCKMEQDGCSKFSDSESVSSNTSENKKHPLFIGKNVKYSFKGMMKTAVERVSHDSDSVKSFSPRPDEDSKPCSPKPDSSVTSAGSNSLAEETDLPADSSTMPDDRNLFEKLSLLTDSGKEDIDKDQGSNSEISTSKGNAEKADTPICSPEEPMETDSAKVTTEDSNSKLSVVSTTSLDNKESSNDGKESSEKDTCETSQDSKRDHRDDPITKNVSSTSRSQSPVCNLSDFDRAKLVGPVTNVQNKLDTEANVKSESENSNDIDLADKKDQVMVKDSKDSSKDPNLLNKLIKPKTEDSVEAMPAVLSETEKESLVKSEVVDGESESSDRKRSAIEDTEDSKPKRSRLDFVIGKLGTQIGISPENIKCDEAMFDSDIDDSGKTSSESTENRSEEVTSEDDETPPGSSCKRLSEESLEHLIKQKIKEVLEQQKEMLTKQFQEKINELQASNELWKSKAKELHRRALELMNHQQRQDRRRAARESGQRRNVGIQVGEDRIISANQQTTSKGSSSPGRVLPLSSVTSTNPMSLLSSKPTTVPSTTLNKPPSNQVLVQRMPMPNAVRPTQNNLKDQASTMKSILNNSGIGQLSGVTQTIPAVAQSAQTGKPAVTKPTASQLPISSSIQTPPVQTLVKVIDLTADEENSSAKGLTSVRSVAGQSLLNPAMYRPATTTSLPSGARLVFSSATGTSFISNPTALTSAQPRQAGVQYQYLYAPTNQAVTTGNVVTLVSPPAGGGNTAARSAPAPPQLTRPTQPAVSRPSQTNTSLRAPPPLQSAPMKLPPSTVAAKDKQEIKSVSTDKSVTKTCNPLKHPAPLPAPPPTIQDTSNIEKALPPKPGLKISRVSQGIVLSWNMIPSSSHAEIASYQLFAYQETSAPISSNLWKKVGDVKALPLPMACTLTQFQEGNKYHFAVRAVDVHGRTSVFSDPSTIHLVVQNSK